MTPHPGERREERRLGAGFQRSCAHGGVLGSVAALACLLTEQSQGREEPVVIMVPCHSHRPHWVSPLAGPPSQTNTMELRVMRGWGLGEVWVLQGGSWEERCSGSSWRVALDSRPRPSGVQLRQPGQQEMTGSQMG